MSTWSLERARERLAPHDRFAPVQDGPAEAFRRDGPSYVIGYGPNEWRITPDVLKGRIQKWFITKAGEGEVVEIRRLNEAKAYVVEQRESE